MGTAAMERIGFAFAPLRDASPSDIVGWARRAEGLGYDGAWLCESFADSLAYAQAAAVQEFSGGRLVLGLGVGHRAVNEPLGIDMGDPLGKMREVVATLRTSWV